MIHDSRFTRLCILILLQAVMGASGVQITVTGEDAVFLPAPLPATDLAFPSPQVSWQILGSGGIPALEPRTARDARLGGGKDQHTAAEGPEPIPSVLSILAPTPQAARADIRADAVPGGAAEGARADGPAAAPAGAADGDVAAGRATPGGPWVRENISYAWGAGMHAELRVVGRVGEGSASGEMWFCTPDGGNPGQTGLMGWSLGLQHSTGSTSLAVGAGGGFARREGVWEPGGGAEASVEWHAEGIELGLHALTGGGWGSTSPGWYADVRGVAGVDLAGVRLGFVARVDADSAGTSPEIHPNLAVDSLVTARLGSGAGELTTGVTLKGGVQGFRVMPVIRAAVEVGSGITIEAGARGYWGHGAVSRALARSWALTEEAYDGEAGVIVSVLARSIGSRLRVGATVSYIEGTVLGASDSTLDRIARQALVGGLGLEYGGKGLRAWASVWPAVDISATGPGLIHDRAEVGVDVSFKQETLRGILLVEWSRFPAFGPLLWRDEADALYGGLLEAPLVASAPALAGGSILSSWAVSRSGAYEGSRGVGSPGGGGIRVIGALAPTAGVRLFVTAGVRCSSVLSEWRPSAALGIEVAGPGLETEN